MIHLESGNFKENIASGVCLVDFFAEWCGPCKMLGRVLEQIDEEKLAVIYKVDIDDCEDLAKEYGIMVVPTMIIFKDGVLQEKLTGFMQKTDILEKLSKY